VPEAKRKETRFLAVGMLVDDALWRQALAKSPVPRPAEVNQRMVELIDGLKKSNRTLQDFCRETGQTEVQIQAKMTAMLQWRDFVKDRVTDGQLRQYYADYKPFFDGDMVHVSHIALRVQPNASESERKAAWDKLLTIKKDLLAGKIDFAAAAKQYSVCPSHDNGGDLGDIPRKWGMVDESFARAAYDPNLKIGDVTGPVQTEFVFHLIKITGRKEGTPSEFDKIKEEVRELLFEDMRQAMIAEQRKTAKVTINLE
jgi:parvulin-like peptidyl-prolyl isomerase